MSNFKGQELYSIDNKGRVNIPAKMRKYLTPEALDTFVVTRGLDDCIVAYPLDEWKKYEIKFKDLNQYNADNRKFLRTILIWSEEIPMDSSQRIMLPKRLLDFAEIDNKVMIVGMLDHIEFWNPEKFDKYMNGGDETYEQISAKVMS